MNPTTANIAEHARPGAGRWLLVALSFAAFAWSLPRPFLQDEAIESGRETAHGRLAFRTARRLIDFAGKGAFADETELSGPQFADGGQTLYFARSRAGQRAEIVRSRRDGDRWSRAELARELNSVDDDRHVTISADGRSLVLSSNRSGGRGGFDLFVSQAKQNRWSRPDNIGSTINTPDDELDPALAPDGRTLFFVRKTSGASADVFLSRRDSDAGEWSSPQRVASINSPDSDDISPSVSPDGRWLYFASNRPAHRGEQNHFDLFRAPINDSVVGTPQRVHDGIGSTTDELDPAFAPDGQTLVFTSRREGASQLYLSRADFVVTRLAWSAEHLERFGRAWWAVPIICGVIFTGLVWRMLRGRATGLEQYKPARAAQRAVPPASVALPPQRSTPPKNPLATWQVAAPTDAPTAKLPTRQGASDKSARPKTALKEAPSPTNFAASKSSVSRESLDGRRRGRRIWQGLALLTASALLLFAMMPSWNWWSDWSRLVSSQHEDGHWDEFARFHEGSAPRAAELPNLTKFDTLRTTAPDLPNAIPIEEASLRQAARWPSDRVVVRQPMSVERRRDADPALTGAARGMPPTKAMTIVATSRLSDVPSGEIKLASASLATESPFSAASTTVSKRPFDPPAEELIRPRPILANSATLQTPMRRALDIVPLPSALGAALDLRPKPLDRFGVSMQARQPNVLPDSETAVSLTVATATEPALTSSSISLARVESRAASLVVDAISSSPRSLPLERRPIPLQPLDRDSLPITDVNAVAKPIPVNPLLRSTVSPQLSTLIDEEPLTSSAPAPDETVVPAPPVILARYETVSVASAPDTTLAKPREDLSALRRGTTIESVELAGSTLWSLLGAQVARRETHFSTGMAAAMLDDASGATVAAPALLQTSATMIVELLPQAMLAPLPKLPSAGPALNTPPEVSASLAKSLPRNFVTVRLSVAEAPAAPLVKATTPSMPRRLNESAVIGLKEEIQPIFE